MLTVAEASAKVLEGLTPVAAESVPIAAALGRTLAEDVRARLTQPPADLSAMDGYAVKAADVAKLPATLKVIGAIAAGQVFSGDIKSGQAVRIFTGAPLPKGANAVVIQENTKANGDTVQIVDGATPAGKNVRRAGLDFKEGDVLLKANRRLSAHDISLAAAMNHARLNCRRAPRVAILASGDELVQPGTTPGPGQIVASSSAGLSAAIVQWGGAVRDLGIAHDDVTDIRFKAEMAQGADIFVTLGGASVGDHDLIQKALADDLKVAFWKIAMRPGKPLIHGRYKSIPFLGLPGNPVSAFVCARLFLKAMIFRLLGMQEPALPTFDARLVSPLVANDQRQDYLRCKITRQRDGTLDAEPFPLQDSSMLRPLAEAQGLLIRPPHDPARQPGEIVTVALLD